MVVPCCGPVTHLCKRQKTLHIVAWQILMEVGMQFRTSEKTEECETAQLRPLLIMVVGEELSLWSTCNVLMYCLKLDKTLRT